MFTFVNCIKSFKCGSVMNEDIIKCDIRSGADSRLWSETFLFETESKQHPHKQWTMHSSALPWTAMLNFTKENDL